MSDPRNETEFAANDILSALGEVYHADPRHPDTFVVSAGDLRRVVVGVLEERASRAAPSLDSPPQDDAAGGREPRDEDETVANYLDYLASRDEQIGRQSPNSSHQATYQKSAAKIRRAAKIVRDFIRRAPSETPSAADSPAATTDWRTKYWAIVEDVHELLKLDTLVTGLDNRAEQIREHLRSTQPEPGTADATTTPSDDEVRAACRRFSELYSEGPNAQRRNKGEAMYCVLTDFLRRRSTPAGRGDGNG